MPRRQIIEMAAAHRRSVSNPNSNQDPKHVLEFVADDEGDITQVAMRAAWFRDASNFT